VLHVHSGRLTAALTFAALAACREAPAATDNATPAPLKGLAAAESQLCTAKVREKVGE
jgi:nitrous oxide reductase accessory protein NosL